MAVMMRVIEDALQNVAWLPTDAVYFRSCFGQRWARDSLFSGIGGAY